MLRTLKDLFDRLQPDGAASPAAPAGLRDSDRDHAVRLAAAVLLVEVMRADAEFSAAEQASVLGALRGLFDLDADEAERLAELARTTAHGATDLYGFTSRINERFEMTDKIRIVEAMWRVAHADGTLGAHERHLMWRVGDLLHVPTGALHLARARAAGGGA